MYFIQCTASMQPRTRDVERVGVPGRVSVSGLEWAGLKEGGLSRVVGTGAGAAEKERGLTALSALTSLDFQ